MLGRPFPPALETHPIAAIRGAVHQFDESVGEVLTIVISTDDLAERPLGRLNMPQPKQHDSQIVQRTELGLLLLVNLERSPQVRGAFVRPTSEVQEVSKAVLGLRHNAVVVCCYCIGEDRSPTAFSFGEVAAEVDNVAAANATAEP